MNVERHYYAWRARTPQQRDDPLAAFGAGYRVGGSDALRASSELAGLVRELRQLIWWLEAEDEHERAVAWAESNLNADVHDIVNADQEEMPF